MKTRKSKKTSGPSTAIGIRKFNEDSAGPKIDPQGFIIFLVIVIVLVLIIKTALPI